MILHLKLRCLYPVTKLEHIQMGKNVLHIQSISKGKTMSALSSGNSQKQTLLYPQEGYHYLEYVHNWREAKAKRLKWPIGKNSDETFWTTPWLLHSYQDLGHRLHWYSYLVNDYICCSLASIKPSRTNLTSTKKTITTYFPCSFWAITTLYISIKAKRNIS